MPRIGPLVAYPLTPRGEDGRLLTGSFERLVDGAITAGANAVGVLGSTGGFAYMPRTARKRITRSAVEVADGRVPVIVGVGALSTAEVLANLAEAHSVGASGALLQPMAYQPLTFDEIYGLYKDASAATEIPLWVYNNPATTGHRFSVEQLAKISRLSAVAGFKDRAANATDAKDRMERIAGALPPRTARQIDWGFSGDGIGAQVLLAGASTWHSGLAGVLPEICVAIAQAATSGHAPHARVLQRQLTPLAIIVRQYGGIRTAHSIAQMLGLDAGTLPRPLAPLPADARTLVRMALESIAVPDAPTEDEAVPHDVDVPQADSSPQVEAIEVAEVVQRQAAPTPTATATATATPKTKAKQKPTGTPAPVEPEPEAVVPVEPEPAAGRRAAPARTRAAARTASDALADVPPVAGPDAADSQVADAAEPPAQPARRPEPTKTGAVMVTPERAQPARPAPVRSDGASSSTPSAATPVAAAQSTAAPQSTVVSQSTDAPATPVVPPPRSLGRSRAEQPRRVRTPPTPVADDDDVTPDETTSGLSGRHSG